ncbi:hypothetical protein N7462_002993 [Penicillium macrosclerotiorum]|uniref:uncharacterized protein n=1 Tax=Penicillium macrosclerotiorum TaxID=303699 RepID=UPI002547A3E3|nr:uncharacterized protein N7462_002993 [Penicillium macrosclerotiorum]KAJ5688601.1 hypothetical protein N7462_002993 [Penicillium macrosclerotiorum]
MAPSHRRGPWVPEEDQLLLQLVREQGPNNWVRISQHMHYRSPKQCRERFHQNLKPSLNREPISADEGLMIERMVNEMGKRWAEIARRLGNRSDNAVKNWWNGSMNRKRRGLSTPTAPARTFNGRIEAPYARASVVSPNRPRYATRPWAESPVESTASSDVFSSHSRRESMSTTRQLSPIYTLPSINRPIETPLTSPAFSEASNATSIEPPSMMSDHNSVCSSSPRTLPSPQLLPMSAEMRSQYDVRRPSTVSVHVVDDSPSYPARSLESLSGIASKRRWTEHQSTLASWHQPADSLPKPWQSRPVEPPRDTRMGVNNLLN